MKKIKYIILVMLFSVIFLTDVKAECTNFINFNNSGRFAYNVSFDYNFTSDVSFSISNIDSSITVAVYSFNTPLSSGNYILSFDISSNIPPTEPFSFSLYNSNNSVYNFTNLLSDYTINSTNFKYSFSVNQNNQIYQFRFGSNGVNSINMENFKLYSASEYDSCTSSINTYTYTFYVDEDVYETDTVEEGTLVELPDPPTKEGYTFTGWTLNGESYTGGEITSDIDIYATFEEIVVVPSNNVDLSGIIPYLVVIASLIMLFIEIIFIRNMFKSRR